MRQSGETPPEGGDFWIFGYGWLIWKPGFEFVESALAHVQGWHRSLCIFSHVHRGAPEKPGLVLGLDHGGSCQGVAFRVAAALKEATLAYLRERELVTSVYLEKTLQVEFAEGGHAQALAYVVDRSHAQYAGRLPLEEITRLVSTARTPARTWTRRFCSTCWRRACCWRRLAWALR